MAWLKKSKLPRTNDLRRANDGSDIFLLARCGGLCRQRTHRVRVFGPLATRPHRQRGRTSSSSMSSSCTAAHMRKLSGHKSFICWTETARLLLRIKPVDQRTRAGSYALLESCERMRRMPGRSVTRLHDIIELMNRYFGLLEAASKLPAGAEQQAAFTRLNEFHDRLAELVVRAAKRPQ